MKLDQLLEKITRLPWFEISACDGDKWIGTEQGDAEVNTPAFSARSLGGGKYDPVNRSLKFQLV